MSLVLPPQVILGLPYGMPIDMWSFACILAELLTGYPLFPGEDEVEQLACVMEVLGLPPAPMVAACTRKKRFFEADNSPKIVANSRGKKRRPSSKDLSTVLRCGDASFVSFLEGCLHWDPDVRFTPDQAFQHPWIQVCVCARAPAVAALAIRDGCMNTLRVTPMCRTPLCLYLAQ